MNLRTMASSSYGAASTARYRSTSAVPRGGFPSMSRTEPMHYPERALVDDAHPILLGERAAAIPPTQVPWRNLCGRGTQD